MNHQEKIDLDNDLRMIDNYTKLVNFHFRRFKKNCDTCYSKTEKEFHPVYNDLWDLIHCLPFKLKTEISQNFTLRRHVDFFYNRFKSLPCNLCKQHYNNYMRENPLRNIKTNYDLQMWTIELHNEVNRRLNKNVFFYNQAKSLYTHMTIR